MFHDLFAAFSVVSTLPPNSTFCHIATVATVINCVSCLLYQSGSATHRSLLILPPIYSSSTSVSPSRSSVTAFISCFLLFWWKYYFYNFQRSQSFHQRPLQTLLLNPKTNVENNFIPHSDERRLLLCSFIFLRTCAHACLQSWSSAITVNAQPWPLPKSKPVRSLKQTNKAVRTRKMLWLWEKCLVWFSFPSPAGCRTHAPLSLLYYPNWH